MMAECLCCLGRLGMRHSCCEEVRVVTAEVFLSFQYASTAVQQVLIDTHKLIIAITDGIECKRLGIS